MMGSFLTRGLVMVLGYAYPAYECFKTVEMNKPEIEQLRFWCQYWILVAVLTVFERVGDTFVSWLPMYSEAKLAFFVYLWYPKTRGTAYVYDSFLRPYVAKHETEIDRNLLELRTRAGDIAVLYWQRAASYGQTRVFEILQYVASQSPKPRPAQQQQKAGVRPPPPTAPTRQPATQQTQPEQPLSRQPSNPATVQQWEPSQEADPTPVPPSAAPQAQTTAPGQASTETTTASPSAVAPSEGEAMQVETTAAVVNGSPNPPPQEVVMEEAIGVMRRKLRKTRAATAPATNR
ncbi:putative HVA22-like protein g [Magnolia sinica]|uniref:putative HVA22-like protein g n=1 Tax=Magnolia sinica TaxID=86752 RepID=UPI00265A0AD9|nr:putative HVA22-like protein g [Magnolia sinica]